MPETRRHDLVELEAVCRQKRNLGEPMVLSELDVVRIVDALDRPETPGRTSAAWLIGVLPADWWSEHSALAHSLLGDSDSRVIRSAAWSLLAAGIRARTPLDLLATKSRELAKSHILELREAQRFLTGACWTIHASPEHFDEVCGYLANSEGEELKAELRVACEVGQALQSLVPRIAGLTGHADVAVCRLAVRALGHVASPASLEVRERLIALQESEVAGVSAECGIAAERLTSRSACAHIMPCATVADIEELGISDGEFGFVASFHETVHALGRSYREQVAQAVDQFLQRAGECPGTDRDQFTRDVTQVIVEHDLSVTSRETESVSNDTEHDPRRHVRLVESAVAGDMSRFSVGLAPRGPTGDGDLVARIRRELEAVVDAIPNRAVAADSVLTFSFLEGASRILAECRDRSRALLSPFVETANQVLRQLEGVKMTCAQARTLVHAVYAAAGSLDCNVVVEGRTVVMSVLDDPKYRHARLTLKETGTSHKRRWSTTSSRFPSASMQNRP